MYKDYTPILWTEINSWGFKELSMVEKKQIDAYFDQYRFFDEELEFMENAKEIISVLSQKYKIVVCTIGTQNNLKLKQEWLSKYLPCISEFIGVDINTYKDKAHVDMSDGIAFIDDNENNLMTSNCKVNICYGDLYSWNKSWEGIRCYNWTDVLNFINYEVIRD